MLKNDRLHISNGGRNTVRANTNANTSMSITATTTTSAAGTKLPSLTNNKSPNSTDVSANPFNSLKSKGRFNSAIDVVTDA